MKSSIETIVSKDKCPECGEYMISYKGTISITIYHTYPVCLDCLLAMVSGRGYERKEIHKLPPSQNWERLRKHIKKTRMIEEILK